MFSPLSYHTPPGSAVRRSRFFDIHTFLWASILVFAFIVIMVFIVPLLAGSLRDLRSELPRTTEVLLAISRATAGGWWVALLAIPPGLGFLVAQFGPLGRRLARMTILIAFGGLVLFVMLGIFQPMLTLVEDMTSAK